MKGLSLSHFFCRVEVGVLSFLAGTLLLQGGEVSTEISLPPVLDSGQGFSFRSGKLDKIKEAVGDYSLNIDLMWDPPHGLFSNNSDLTKPFNGKGGIIDVGKKKLSEVQKA